MIVQLTWHGEPIGRLDVQFVWPPPLDRGALLPLLSASSGSAAISVLFQFCGALNALELDLARPVVLHGPLGGPTEVGVFQGHVEARFDEIDVHGFVAASLGSRAAKGPRVSIQREADGSGFAVEGSGFAGQLEIVGHSGSHRFGAAVEGSRSQLRAFPHGGGVVELRADRGSVLSASLNWRWPRSFEAESPWAVALQTLLEFLTEHPSSALLLGFELAPEEAFWERPSQMVSAPPASHRPTTANRARPAARSSWTSRVVLLGGVAVALVAAIAAALLWNPSGIQKDAALLIPASTVATGALQPLPARSIASGDVGGDAGKKR